jgi:L-fuconolactonase
MGDPRIIDAHVHFWDPDGFSTPWLERVPDLNKRHMPSEYTDAAAGLPVRALVFVECTRDDGLREARRVAELSAKEERIQAIVAWAPLEKGEAVRDDLRLLAMVPRVKGVRRLIERESAPDFCTRPAFLQGLRALRDFRLSFDICITHDQLPMATEMVRACPDVSFILDHIAKPDIRSGLLEPWRTNIRKLAAQENVVCKVSGLVTEAGPGWTKEQLEPYFDTVIDCFGADRVVYGGDWPMVRLAAEYDQWFEALQWLVRGMTALERQQLFHDNAKKAYRF